MSRKTVLFIVEGKTEKEALGSLIVKLFNEYFSKRYRIEFIIEKTDITSTPGMTPRCILEWTCINYINPFLSRSCLLPEDIAAVVQFIDMDGSFIQDEFIYESKNCIGTSYHEEYIQTKSKKDIITRNKRKKANIEYLRTIEKISLQKDPEIVEATYRCYFFSTNLDHFLYGMPNLTNTDKSLNSAKFAKVNADLNDFLELIGENGELSKFLTPYCDYERSWQHITEGLNSLQRLSNIDVLVNTIQYHPERLYASEEG